MEDIIANNPCVKFIVDNYEMLCRAHSGRVVMVVNGGVMIEEAPKAYVAKTFGSMIEAMMYTDSMDMGHVPYALKACDGSEVTYELLFSKGCTTAN